MWLWLTVASSALLGLYDIAKKHALHENAVLPVLFLATLSGGAVVVPWIGANLLWSEAFSDTALHVHILPPRHHLLVAAKALLVTASWVSAYFALKHLPVSVVSPIRASSPVWTVVGAVLLFHESPTLLQWIGVGVIFVSYYWMSIVGRKEGIVFHRNRWVLCIVLATLTGAASALYDKYLLQRLLLPPLTLQAWFSLYLLLLQGVLLLFLWYPSRARTTPFRFVWSIPAIGLMLIAADLLYFQALHDPQTLISLVSPIRRSGVVFSFVLGGLLFGEKNKRLKAPALAGVLAGVFMVLLGG